jgi:uncharacterized protein YycO
MRKQLLMVGVAFIGVTIFATGTVAVLNYMDSQQKNSDTNSAKTKKKAEQEPMQEFKEDIDENKNAKAELIEESAMSLIESNPKEAHKKYLEAEKAYKEAGNMGKVGEMRANALSAQAEIDARKTAN